MSRSPIFRRITLTEVKKTSNKRGSLLRELNSLLNEEKEIIKNHHDPSYSNWRASFLREEGMTTDGFMQTQLKGEGDTDLATIAGNAEASYQAYEGGSEALSGTAIIASGTGTGSDGGFDLGQTYLSFNSSDPTSPRFAALKPIDSSKFDTIVVTGIRGNDTNGGEDPDEENEDLMVYYQLPGQNIIQRLDVNGGVTQSGIDFKIIPVGSDDSGLQEYSLTLPSYTRAEGVRFILYQPAHSGTGFDNYGITQINYRRLKPISVLVSLDSPEASAFIRVGSPSRASESKKQREKQLREQLEATKDYTDKKFGENFPGSEVAAPGEEDPTEQAQKAPGIGEFEPEVVDYNTWKQETKREDPEAKTTEKEFEKWKDEKALKSFAKVRDAQQGGVLPPSPPVDSQDTKSFDTFQKVSDLHATPGVTDAEKEVGARIAEKEPEEIKAALKDMEKALDKDKFYEPKREDFPPGIEGTKEWRKAKNEDAFASIAQQIGSAGKVYINYLLGNLKDGAINNQFLGQEYVNSLIKNIDISKNQGMIPYIPPGYGSDQLSYIFVGGDNVIGSGGTPTYDPKTGIVTFPFNYDFDTNLEQIIKEPDKYDFNTDDSLSIIDRIKGSSSQQMIAFLGMFAAWVLGGKYGLDSVPVPGAGYATWLAKLLGKAQGTTDHAITMSLDDIKKLNPKFAAQLRDYGLLRSSEEWQGTEEQQTQLYKDLEDLFATNPDRANEVMQQVSENPEYKKLADEARELRDILNPKTQASKDYDHNPAARAAYDDYEALQAKHKAEEEKRWNAMSKIKMFDVTLNPDGSAKSMKYTPQYEKALTAYNKFVSDNSKEAKAFYDNNYQPAASGKGGYKNFPSANDLRSQLEAEYKVKIDQSLQAFNQAAYDALNPQLTQVSDTSLHGTKIASALKKKIIKGLEDAAKSGDTEALEKSLEKLKDYNEKQKKGSGAGFDFTIDDLNQSGLPDGTQIARYKKPAYTPPYVQDWEKLGGGGERTSPTGGDLKNWDPNAKIKASTQQDFGSIAQAYGGQGVDAATLASTAAATQEKKKKKKTTVTASYKPKGSMISEKRKLKTPSKFFNSDDIKPEYPKDPPPKMINNYHPNLVDGQSVSNRFNKLDPASAKAMPKTSYPAIDAKVEKAKKQPK